MSKPFSDIAVGDRFELVRTCDRLRPTYYAAASGDFNPIHLDPEVGQKAGLGGVILHGMCTMAWMGEAAVRFFGDPTLVTRLQTRFVRPVAIGDTITFTGTVVEAGNGRVVAEIAATNQRGEDVLKGGQVEARTERGPGPAPEAHPGKTYGPNTYEVGAEKLREFAYAIGGGIPSMAWEAPPPADLPREYWDAAYARERHGGLVAPPTFCVNFAIRPFVACSLDPDLAIDMLRLVHGEQAFEFLEPVRAGDVLTSTGHVVEHFERGNKVFLIVETVSANQHGRVAVKARWTVIIRK